LVERVEPLREREVALPVVGEVQDVTAVGRLDVRDEGVDEEDGEDEDVGEVEDVSAAGASRPQLSQKPSSSMVPSHPVRGHLVTRHSSCPAVPAGSG
jgi:hypothetical protein